ncbi:hypothetical protein K438DRAFT_1934368 [Mycena galopus ATCC 62051]|nr:hypothetical protein K438DRAFT_1934368 [Mycena galopus ATCC 62051]
MASCRSFLRFLAHVHRRLFSLFLLATTVTVTSAQPIAMYLYGSSPQMSSKPKKTEAHGPGQQQQYGAGARVTEYAAVAPQDADAASGELGILLRRHGGEWERGPGRANRTGCNGMIHLQQLLAQQCAPALAHGLRGLMYFKLAISGPGRDPPFRFTPQGSSALPSTSPSTWAASPMRRSGEVFGFILTTMFNVHFQPIFLPL